MGAPARDPICDPSTGVVSGNWLTYFSGLDNGSGIAGFSNVTINRSFTGGASQSLDITVDAFRLTGTELAPNVINSSLKRVGTLTGGATGRGFNVDFGNSTFLGNLAWANMPFGAGTWTAEPTIIGMLSVVGGITVLDDIVPLVNFRSNLGRVTSKFLTVWAAELWVETLVAQDVMATIGGRIVVAPTTYLTLDLAPGDTTITVKHNNLSNGNRVRMEGDLKIEWMAITSGASGSAGAYVYSVTRNLDGTGANQWYIGDAVLNTGTTGNGFIDLYSIAGVLSGAGPTIVGNVRTGTTYSQVAPRWAVGNLSGIYNYPGPEVYGAAFGDASAINVTVDATNGFRIRNGTTDKFTADIAGNLSLVGNLTMGTSGVFKSGATAFATATGIWMDFNGGTPRMRVGNPAGDQVSWDGSTLTITGTVTITGGNAAKKDFSNVTANYAASNAVAGPSTRVVGALAAAPSGAGLYLGSDFMGYYNGSAWKTYFDNAGNMTLSGSGDNSLVWNGSALQVNARYLYCGSNGGVDGLVGVWSSSTAIGGGTPVPGAGMYLASNSLRFYNNYGSGAIAFDNGVSVLGSFAATGALSGTALTLSTGGIILTTDGNGIVIAGSTVLFSSSAGQVILGTGDGGSSITFWSGGGSAAKFDSNKDFFPIADGSRHNGVPSNRWADVYAVNGTIQTSDRRQKRDITACELGIEFLMALRPSSYYMTGDSEPRRRKHGLIAQDLANIVGPLSFGDLYYDETGEANGLNYSGLWGPAITVIQDHERRLRALERTTA